MKFSRDATESAFTAREAIAGKDARTLATEILAMPQEEFGATFRKSPVKRTKLAGLQRNAYVTLQNLGDSVTDPDSDQLAEKLPVGHPLA